MKKFLLTALALLFVGIGNAQSALNNAADNIVGSYSGTQDGEQFRAKITKQSDGTYQGQIVWMKNDKDENGNKRLDTKNPDKSLRNTPCDRITKIYDPQRGIKARLTVTFEQDGRLRLKGSVFAFSESVYWTKVQ